MTVEVSPNVQLHTWFSSCSRVKALRGCCIRKTSRSYSREVRDQLAADPDLVRGQVDRQVPVGDGAGSGVRQAGAAGAAQHRADPQRQLTRAERLGDVVVGAGLEADETIGLVPQRGQHDHRDRPPGAEPAAHLETVDAGQHEVEDDEVRGLLGHPAQRLLPVTHAFDVVPVADEVPSDDVGHGRIVVDDHDPAGRIGVVSPRPPLSLRPPVQRSCSLTVKASNRGH